ncbi:helix-turn-helix transcriptional regulator [Nonomuraea sp. NN258]|uniref:helix-turn-helix transcriptional regulator n=1 Tax=Nonomuraea antri TaxID=2730852 RepID=UPI0015698A73|nr:helix-turn-helix transcriptional regulator [Nonomuraea antri]NRQ35894.1 helix-turn-helix transcriptional regulator [Nonomuraea antri]
MSHPWRGWCLLRPGLLLYGGTVGSNELHAHHAVQLIVAGEPFTMADAQGGRLTTRIAVIPPDIGHTVLDGAREALLVHLDPRSSPGRALLARSGAGTRASSWSGAAPEVAPAPVPNEPGHPHLHQRPHPHPHPHPHPSGGRGGIRPLMFAAPPADHARSAEATAALRVLEEWSGHGDAADVLPHPSVEAAIALIPTLLRGGPVRLRAVADAVHLSPSRLAHLFSAHVGIPLRPYVRWLRLRRAIDRVAAGETLTAAAHTAGFTDGPHFTRAFRRTFGNTPSELAAAIDWLP